MHYNELPSGALLTAIISPSSVIISTAISCVGGYRYLYSGAQNIPISVCLAMSYSYILRYQAIRVNGAHNGCANQVL